VLRVAVAGKKHQFRFIVSPEDGGVDLTLFTRALMDQVERDLGRRLVWGAVNHHDTDNPHVHVVVRGVDTRGQEVRIDREYLSRRMRWRAQEIVTRELGPRAPAELERQRDREVGQERLRIDRELRDDIAQRAGHAQGDEQVCMLQVLASVPSPDDDIASLARKRLQDEVAAPFSHFGVDLGSGEVRAVPLSLLSLLESLAP